MTYSMYRFFKGFCVVVLGVVLIVGLFCPTYASVKTLPKGVWKVDLSKHVYSFVKGGVNPSGDKITWEDRSVDSFVMSDVPTFVGVFQNFKLGGLPDAANINLDTQLAEFWNRNRTVLDVSYGVTDKFSVFGTLTKEMGQLKYTDAFVAQTQLIEQVAAGLGAAGAALKASNNVKPSFASSDRLRDVYVGAKYRFNDDFAVATKLSAGFLRIGHDPLEIVVLDGVEELSTGKGYDEYQLYALYDTALGNIPIHTTLGYILKGEETHRTLENNFTVKHGNILVLGVSSSVAFSSVLNMQYGLTFLSAGADQYKGGNSQTLAPVAGFATLTDVPASSVSALMANIRFTHIPKKHVRFYVNLDIPVSNSRTGQVYDFPGRIEPGVMLALGTQVFLK